MDYQMFNVLVNIVIVINHESLRLFFQPQGRIVLFLAHGLTIISV